MSACARWQTRFGVAARALPAVENGKAKATLRSGVADHMQLGGAVYGVGGAGESCCVAALVRWSVGRVEDGQEVGGNAAKRLGVGWGLRCA